MSSLENQNYFLGKFVKPRGGISLLCLMKRFILLAILSLCSVALAETPRNWVLANGHIFSASLQEFDKDTAVLNLEGGKTQRVPVASLSVADRYYLHTEHKVPYESLEGGNYLAVERDIKIDESEFKTISSIKLEGEGYKVELGALVTPHFVFFHDKGAKVKEYAQGLEKVIFSHSYRMPTYADLEQKQRRSLLIIKDRDFYMDLGKSMVDTMRKEGKASNRQINQLEVNWVQYAGRTNYQIPAELAQQYETNASVNITFAQSKQADRLAQTRDLINRYWNGYPHRSGIRGGHSRSCKEKLPQDEPRYRQSCGNNVYTSAIAGSSTMRFWGSYDVRGGGGGETGGYIGYGRFGDPKKWGAELASKVKAGKIKPSFEDFYRTPSNCAEVITGDELRDYWLPVAGLSRFFDQDIRHQIGTCRLLEFMRQHRRTPNKEEMPALFDYSSVEELEAAFKDFLLTKCTKLKY